MRNADTTTMRDVCVVEISSSYSLGDVPAGLVRSVCVKPTGESSLVIEYADAAGKRSVSVGCYMEAGYSGSISVNVAKDAVVKREDKIGFLLGGG